MLHFVCLLHRKHILVHDFVTVLKSRAQQTQWRRCHEKNATVCMLAPSQTRACTWFQHDVAIASTTMICLGGGLMPFDTINENLFFQCIGVIQRQLSGSYSWKWKESKITMNKSITIIGQIANKLWTQALAAEFHNGQKIANCPHGHTPLTKTPHQNKNRIIRSLGRHTRCWITPMHCKNKF